jgi:serine O-acetyltransferase
VREMDHPINDLVARMLESYAECGGIKHLNGASLPSKNAVAALTQDLLQIIFPGFIADGEQLELNLAKETAVQLTDLQERLEREIAKSLEARSIANETALSLTLSFLRQLPDLRCVIQTDVDAAFQGDPAALDREEVVLAYPGIEAVAVFRMAHVLYGMGVGYLPRMMTEWAHSRTGIDIHPGATIGSHFFIDHGTGVVIGGTTKIGDRVRLYQGVGLVARSLAKHVERDEQGLAIGGKRHPTVGDDVTIYANATIVGGDTTIGERTIVGGNVWLTRSVPPDSVVFFEAQQVSIHPRQRMVGDWII